MPLTTYNLGNDDDDKKKEEEEIEDIDINDPNFESEGLVALCADCLSVIPDAVWTKDKFLVDSIEADGTVNLTGLPGVCRYCKGSTFVMPIEIVEQERAKRRSGRPMAG